MIFIYEMVVNKTNVSVSISHFLDMTISVFRGKFFIKLYDLNVMTLILMLLTFLI